jgi:hypothetical protein
MLTQEYKAMLLFVTLAGLMAYLWAPGPLSILMGAFVFLILILDYRFLRVE